MKSIIYVFIFSTILTSCSKVNPIDNPYGVTEDKNTFFKIAFNGKTLTTTGVKFSNPLFLDLLFDFCYAELYTATYSGVVKSQISLEIDPLFSSMFGAYGIKDGEVAGDLFAKRTGDAIGTYTDIGSTTSHYIYDYTVGNKEYKIDPGSLVLNVTAVDVNFIKGNFTCKLIDGTNKISAVGSFSLPSY